MYIWKTYIHPLMYPFGLLNWLRGESYIIIMTVMTKMTIKMKMEVTMMMMMKKKRTIKHFQPILYLTTIESSLLWQHYRHHHNNILLRKSIYKSKILIYQFKFFSFTFFNSTISTIHPLRWWFIRQFLISHSLFK